MKKALVLLCFALMISGLMGQLKKGLLVSSYSADYDWDKDYSSALVNDLKAIATMDMFYLNTKKIPKEEFASKADEAWKKFNSAKYDFVVLGDDNALKFLGERLAKSSIPVFFLGINGNPRNYFSNKTLPPNFTGVLERPLFKRSITYAKEICPDIKKMLIFFDNGETSMIVKNDNIDNTDKINISGIDVEIRTIGDFDQWKKEISRANKEYDAVIIGLYQTLRDHEGKPVSDKDVLNWTIKNLSIKNFAFWEFSVGKEMTTGGLVLSGKEQGKKCAQMIKNYYSTNKLPVIQTPENGKLIFSRAGLTKWKINLPENLKKEALFVE